MINITFQEFNNYLELGDYLLSCKMFPKIFTYILKKTTKSLG